MRDLHASLHSLCRPHVCSFLGPTIPASMPASCSPAGCLQSFGVWWGAGTTAACRQTYSQFRVESSGSKENTEGRQSNCDLHLLHPPSLERPLLIAATREDSPGAHASCFA